MTFDEAFTVAAILSAILVLSGYWIMRQAKPPTMRDVDPGKTLAEQRRRAWADAQKELGSQLRRIK